MARKLKVSVEKIERIVVRQSERSREFCDLCRRETEMFSLRGTALTLKLTERQVMRSIENGAFHFAETPEGFLLICGRSLKGFRGGNILEKEFEKDEKDLI